MQNDTVNFYLDSTPYLYVDNYTLSYDLFKGCAEMSAEIYADTEILLAYREGQPLKFKWEINGNGVMTGFVDSVDKSYSKKGITQTIRGRDYLSILVDNHIFKAQNYDGYKIDTIINSVLNNNKSITVSGTTYTTPNFDLNYSNEALQRYINSIGALVSFKTSVGGSLFDLVNKLLNPAGMYIYNIPGTETFLIAAINIRGHNYDKFGYVKSDAPILISAQRNNPGLQNNVIQGNYRSDIKDLYQIVRIVGDALDINGSPLYQLNVTKQYRCNNTVMKILAEVTNNVDFNIWNIASTKEFLINNIIFKMKRDFCQLKYTLQGHSYNGNDPYYVNGCAKVIDSMIPESLSNRNYLITGVTFRGSKDGSQTTDLELCLPIVDGDLTDSRAVV